MLVGLYDLCAINDCRRRDFLALLLASDDDVKVGRNLPVDASPVPELELSGRAESGGRSRRNRQCQQGFPARHERYGETDSQKTGSDLWSGQVAARKSRQLWQIECQDSSMVHSYAGMVAGSDSRRRTEAQPGRTNRSRFSGMSTLTVIGRTVPPATKQIHIASLQVT